MGDWANLPSVALTHLYTYLSRRDRLSCSMVCETWKTAMDCVMLWKNLRIRIDVDFAEPSTIFLIREYFRHVRNLELGWSYAYRFQRLDSDKYENAIKRTIRTNLLEWQKWRIMEVQNSGRLKTIHQMVEQYRLKRVIFDGITLNGDHYVSIISSCLLTSSHSISHLAFRRCRYSTKALNKVYLMTIIEQFCNVKTLELDYYIMSCNLIDAITTSGNRVLENLILTINDIALYNNFIIRDEQWATLYSVSPELKVTLIVENIAFYDEIRIYLEDGIPLASFVFNFPQCQKTEYMYNFKKTISMLATNYHMSLTNIDVNLKNITETMDESLLKLIRRCRNLKSLLYQGMIGRPQEIQDKIKYMKCFCMDKYLDDLGQNHLVVRPVSNEDLAYLQNKNAMLTITHRNSRKLCSMLLINDFDDYY